MAEAARETQKKNVLILTTVSGFLLKFERDNIRLLQELGYTVHYAANMREQFYPYDQSQMDELGVICHHIDIARSPFMLMWQYRALAELRRIITRCDIHLIHCHTPMGGVLGRLASAMSRERQIPVIYTAHGFHFYQGAPLVNNTFYYLVERMLAQFTDALIVINREDLESACRFQLRPDGICRQLPSVGLDLEKFHAVSPEERSASRRRHGFGDRDYVMLSVGELNENKNQNVILRAMKLLKDRSQLPEDLHYCLCGDGFLRDKLGQMVRELGLTGRVTLYGYCDPVTEYVGMADVLVFPSKREGLGMAAVEALAMGVPVIAADNRGTREYMCPGENGIVCSCDDVEGFARGILRMYEMTQRERAEMAGKCRDSVRRFDRNNAIRIMRDVYARVDRKVCGTCHDLM